MGAVGVQDSELLDLINTTKADLPDNEFEVALQYQRYEVGSRLLPRDRVEIKSGHSISRRIQLKTSGAAGHVQLFEESDINIVDTMSEITIPWARATTHWAVERREVLENRSPARIVELLKTRRVAAMVDLADVLEAAFWTAPAASDTRAPLGLPYWVVPLADSQNTEGFYGCHVTGYSAVGGIVAATSNANTSSAAGGEARWRNWAAGGTGYYTDYDRTAVKTMKKLFLKINFQAPELVDDLRDSKWRHRIYVNANTLLGFEELAENQNDNLGSDLAPFGEQFAFKRVPLTYVPYLDADTRDPVYFVNLNAFKVFVLDGDYLREGQAMNDVRLPNVYTTRVDLSYNYGAINRRLLGVMRKTA